MESPRRRALDVARAVIGGRTSISRGVIELASLQSELCRDPLSATFLPILAAADDLGPPRSIHLLAHHESERLVEQLGEAERQHRQIVLSACRNLVKKLESEGGGR